MYLLIIFSVLQLSQASKIVEIFTSENFTGTRTLLDISSCAEYNGILANSIRTLEPCIHVYRTSNCAGTFLRLQHGVQDANLKTYGFKGNVGSVGKCNRCSDTEFLSNGTDKFSTEKNEVFISTPYLIFPFVQIRLKVDSCVDLQAVFPSGLPEWSFLLRGSCSCLVTYNSPNCQGEYTQLLSSNWYQLWNSTNDECQLFESSLRTEVVKSISPCPNNCTELCARNEFKCPEILKCISPQHLCDGVPDCPQVDDELNCTSVAFGEFNIAGDTNYTTRFSGPSVTSLMTVKTGYYWMPLLKINNSQNEGDLKRTTKITSTYTCSYDSTIKSLSDYSSELKGEISGIEILQVKVSANLELGAKNMYEDTLRSRKEKRVERTIEHGYNIGARTPNFTMFQLGFSGPGISLVLEPISSKGNRVPEEVSITFRIKRTTVLKGIEIVYTEDSASRPEYHMQDVRGREPNVNPDPKEGYVWLVPIWTTNMSDGLTGLEISIQKKQNRNLKNLFEGSNRYYFPNYRYLLYFKDIMETTKISEVALFKSDADENANPKDYGWNHCTANLRDAYYGLYPHDFLYICWKTVPYEDGAEKHNITMQGVYSWEWIMDIVNPDNSLPITMKETIVTSVEASYERTIHDIRETHIGGGLNLDLDGLFGLLKIKGEFNAHAKTGYDSLIESKSEVSYKSEIEDEYEVGPNSALALYRLVFSAPGLSVDLAKGAGGLYRYLVPLKDPKAEYRITEVALYRLRNDGRTPELDGWHNCTGDINQGRDEGRLGKRVHLCWKVSYYVSEDSEDDAFADQIKERASFNTTVTEGPVSAVIVGGKKANHGQIAYAVSLQHQEKDGNPWDHVCGGTIFKPNRVITAAHCCSEHNKPIKGNLRVVAGTVNNKVLHKDHQIVTVQSFVIHRLYKENTLQNDVCLLKLKDALKLNGVVKSIPICTEEPAGGAQCSASGWGDIKSGKETTDLMTVELNIVSKGVCYDKDHWKLPVRQDTICAGGQRGKGICNGDSGGPIVCKGCLAGIASFATKICAIGGKPDVFASAANFRQWFNQQR